MRHISAMYEKSGGTDYRHTCYECCQCKKLNIAKRTVFRCMNFSPDINWNPANIACKFFGVKKGPVVSDKTKEKAESEEVPGQMNIYDFL